MVGAVANGDALFFPFSTIDPNAMRGREFPFAFPVNRNFETQLASLSYLWIQNEPYPSARRKPVVEECKIGGQKCIPTPAWTAFPLESDRFGSILALSVDSAVHRSIFFPNRYPLEGELGESCALVANIEEFLVSFSPYFQPMSASLELFAEGTDEFAIGIEDENGWVIGLVATAFVNGVKVARLVHGDVVSGLPSVLVGKFGPVMMNFVAVFAFPDDEWSRLALLGRKNGRDDKG